jgi:hypothetical protein
MNFILRDDEEVGEGGLKSKSVKVHQLDACKLRVVCVAVAVLF